MSGVATMGKPAAGLSFRALVIFFIALFVLSVPFCWAAATLYGVNRAVASNGFYIVFDLVYFGILALPWLKLSDQLDLTTAQRLEKMCVAWLCLEIAAAVLWSIPWLFLVRLIVAGKGHMWAYLWWAYMDGGDPRYAVADGSVQAMETAGAIVAMLAAVVLLLRLRSGRFTDRQLLALMALEAGEFYGICVYFFSGFFHGLPDLGGPAGLAIKFFGSNLPWLFMPPVVFLWAGGVLIGRRRAA